MTDSSVKLDGYTENEQKEINMIQRLFKRFETEGIVMPDEQRVIYETLSPSMTGQVILDAGCGTGIGTNILAREARSVWGIDSLPENVKFASQLFGNMHVKFDTMDLTNMPNREYAKFHQIVCIDVIEHIADYQKALDTLKSFMKPGVSKLWISTPNRNHDSLSKEKPNNEFHVREWSIGEFYDILIKNFKYVTCYSHDLSQTIDLDSKEFLPVFKCEEAIL